VITSPNELNDDFRLVNDFFFKFRSAQKIIVGKKCVPASLLINFLTVSAIRSPS
jgi:hypothetical protein